MSNDRKRTNFTAGAFVSEDAVRAALERRRRSRPTNNTAVVAQRPLRRWSVAELLARAVPRPPADGVAH
jgi:hypothetical protein